MLTLYHYMVIIKCPFPARDSSLASCLSPFEASRLPPFLVASTIYEGGTMRDRYIKQGRVRAATADQAAMKIRDRWGHTGRLVIGEPQPGWYEYYIEVIEEERR